MDNLARLRLAGYVVALAGLLFAASSLVPGFIPKEQFPWPLFVGSFIYLNGAFMVLIGSRGQDGRLHMGRLRFIRLGFVAVVGLIVWQMLAP